VYVSLFTGIVAADCSLLRINLVTALDQELCWLGSLCRNRHRSWRTAPAIGIFARRVTP